ncbi:MAG: iron-containing alcohol dehydrogenase [Planctomycetaceae bacterium]
MSSAFDDARFALTVESGAALARLREHAGEAVVCTMPEPWALVADQAPPNLHTIWVGSMELAHLREVATTVPDGARIVIGLGGGSSADTAKFVAEATTLPLLQIPTIISVDAAFTAPYGYRDGSRVRYAGNLRPIEVVADPALIRLAPAELNRAGVGDLVSCHTALHDWRLAVDQGRGDVPWNEEAAALGRGVLDELEEAASEIRSVSDEGVRWLATTHRDVGAGCVAWGARFEEGSEHFLAYAIEWMTGGHRVHGQLISTCVLAMSFVQGNDPDRAVRVVRACGVAADPSRNLIDEASFAEALAALPVYAERERLWPSVIETVAFTPGLIGEAWAHLLGATGSP